MIGNFYTLRWVAADLNSRLSGAHIDSIFSQEKDELVCSFREVPDCLVVSCRADTNTCYLHPSFARAKRNSASLFPDCSGLPVRAVGMHPSDRILWVLLPGTLRLVFQFFSARANVLLLDGNRIVSAFQRNRELAGTVYEEPPVGAHPLDLEVLEQDLAQAPPELRAVTVRRALPSLGPVLTRELLFRISISAGRDPVRPEHVRGALVPLLAELDHPHPTLVMGEQESFRMFTLIPLKHLAEYPHEEQGSVHEAIRQSIGRGRAGIHFRERLSLLEAKLRRTLDRTSRSLDAVRSDLARHDRAGDYERSGHLLMGSLDDARKGLSQIICPADDRGGEAITIPLDPAFSVLQNAQKYFDRARKARQAQGEAARRIDSLTARLTRGLTLLEGLHAVGSPEDLSAFLQQHGQAMEEFHVGERSAARENLPFRIFTVDGGFEVWVGKSSANNDTLTLHHAKPHDLWFHARGSSGSHVLLKISTGKGEPSKKAREQAAAIAAYYSKMKTASLVPVAMTEKKYVRKPRGAPPGTVVIEREKVLFVRPALPQTVDLRER